MKIKVNRSKVAQTKKRNEVWRNRQKTDYTDRYKNVTKSDWFKKAYSNKSL